MVTRYIQRQIKEGRIAHADIDFLATLDPTDNKGYTMFIIKSYLSGANLDAIRNRVMEYHTLHGRYHQNIKSIYSFKTFAQFDEYVEKLNSISSRRELKREIKKEAEVIMDTSELYITSPKTHSASTLLGAGTRWCISANSHVHWERYFLEWLVTFYFIQLRSVKLKECLYPDACKIAVVVYPDGKIALYDSADRMIVSEKNTSGDAYKINKCLNKLQLKREMFVPRFMQERLPEVLFYKKEMEATHLNFHGLGITYVPDEISNLTLLNNIELSDNKLETLPKNLRNLKNLKTLYLFNNNINTLEPIYGLTGLQWLGLKGNKNLSRKTINELKRKLPCTRIYSD